MDEKAMTELQEVAARLTAMEQSINKVLQLQANAVKSQLAVTQAQAKIEENMGRLEQNVLKAVQATAAMAASMVKLDAKVEELKVMEAKSVQRIETIVMTGKAMEKTPEEKELLKPRKAVINMEGMSRQPEKKMTLDEMLREGLKNKDR